MVAGHVDVSRDGSPCYLAIGRIKIIMMIMTLLVIILLLLLLIIIIIMISILTLNYYT